MEIKKPLKIVKFGKIDEKIFFNIYPHHPGAAKLILLLPTFNEKIF